MTSMFIMAAYFSVGIGLALLWHAEDKTLSGSCMLFVTLLWPVLAGALFVFVFLRLTGRRMGLFDKKDAQ